MKNLYINFFLLISFVCTQNTLNTSILKIRSFPESYIAEISTNELIAKVISKSTLLKLSNISSQVKQNGLFGISQKNYISFNEQQTIISNLYLNKDINIINKYILLDNLIQFYFFTYYYHDKHIPNYFANNHKQFLDKYKIKYKWNEPGASYIYLHTFLKRLIKLNSKNKWVNYYVELHNINQFDDYPKGD